ncbi:hypothetical protein AVEN_63288-1 [Araneus ventricosus]|uniref:Uncharacterized protein n=1 Tax=Araneus ventricosus TaxID=182803 RepID=A0A4Y2J5A8_ARAVE|nr:hypothetical protein AVEN_63288-1 [Araneus ventricosus]
MDVWTCCPSVKHRKLKEFSTVIGLPFLHLHVSSKLIHQDIHPPLCDSDLFPFFSSPLIICILNFESLVQKRTEEDSPHIQVPLAGQRLTVYDKVNVHAYLHVGYLIVSDFEPETFLSRYQDSATGAPLPVQEIMPVPQLKSLIVKLCYR